MRKILTKSRLILAMSVLCLMASASFAAKSTSKNASSSSKAYQTKYFYDLKGNRKNLNLYLNNKKWLIVMIWAADCHICNIEIAQYIKLHDKLKKTSAEVLGISIDGWKNRKKAFNFIKRHRVNFTNLLIEPEDFAKFYTPITNTTFIGTPTFLVFNRNGKLMAKQTGAIPTSMIEKYIQKNDKPLSMNK